MVADTGTDILLDHDPVQIVVKMPDCVDETLQLLLGESILKEANSDGRKRCRQYPFDVVHVILLSLVFLKELQFFWNFSLTRSIWLHRSFVIAEILELLHSIDLSRKTLVPYCLSILGC